MNHITIYNPNKLHKAGLQNERGLEAALALDFMLKHFDDIIEVGATSPYYYQVHHPIVDPFDPYDKCIKMDAEQYDFTDKNVMCISTIEHMGRSDYGPVEDDPSKPIRFLCKLDVEAKNFLITFPIGANKDLDEYIMNNRKRYDTMIYHRLCYDPPIWRQVLEWEPEFYQSIKYNEPFPNGNGIVVITK